jgi:prevent-host-death family protein
MNEVTMRELRNHGGDVVERVTRGEVLVITRDGAPVAELHPVSKTGVSAEVLLERYRLLPAVDERQWRRDVDEVINQSL